MKEEKPLVSVIVRTKNRPKLVPKALRSIAAQSYRPVEVVLVNDGGCDLDLEDLQGILGDVSLRYVRLEKSAGRARAGNIGIKNANGGYIGFLDDDDLFLPDHLSSLMTAVREQNAGVVYSDAYLVRADFVPDTLEMSVKDRKLFSSVDFSYRDLVIDNYIPLMTILFSRKVLTQVGGFDEQFDLYEDWDMLIRAGEVCPFHHVAKATAEYLQWSSADQVAQEPQFIEKAIRAQLDIIGKHREKFTADIIRELVQARRDFRAKEEEATRLANALRQREEDAAGLRKTLQERDAALDLIHQSHGWKFLLAYYRMRDFLLPEGSKGRALVKALLRPAAALSRTPQVREGPVPAHEEGEGPSSENKVSPPLPEEEIPASAVAAREAPPEAETLSARAGTGTAPRLDDLQSLEAPAPPKEKNHILVIDRSLPAYDKESGGLRMFSLLEILLSLGFRITFLPDDRCETEPYAGDLRRRGIDIVPGDMEIEKFLEQKGSMFSFVIISRPEQTYKYISLVRAYAIHSSIIYDTVDLYWIRHERAAAVTGGSDSYRWAKEYKAMELCNALSADVTFTVTEEEKKILEREIPGVRTEVVPNIHKISVGETPFAARKDLMFIGGFSHLPNEDAVLYFVREIFPFVREKLRGIKFFVVGSDPSPAVSGLSSTDVIVTGYVKDVSPYFDGCRIFVSPLRYGAGMKGKIGQSMSFGLPVVTTTIGAEGIGLRDGENALIADDPGAFANAVVRLYEDEALWNRISRQSVEHIKENYSPPVLGKRIRDIFDGMRAMNAGA